jgi:hypothetical protein
LMLPTFLPLVQCRPRTDMMQIWSCWRTIIIGSLVTSQHWGCM